MEGMKWYERFAAAWEAMRQSDHGWTQEKLAEILDVDQTTISNWLRGKRSPSLDTLLRLAEVLGLHPAYLIFGIRPEQVVAGTDAAQLAHSYMRLPESQRVVIRALIDQVSQRSPLVLDARAESTDDPEHDKES